MKKLSKLGVLLCALLMAMLVLPFNTGIPVSAEESWTYYVSTATTQDTVGIAITFDDTYISGLQDLDLDGYGMDFEIYIYDPATKKYKVCKKEIAGDNKHWAFYKVTGLKKNTTYYFKVGVKGEDGKIMAKSKKFKAKTKPAPLPDIYDVSQDLDSAFVSIGHFSNYDGTYNVCAVPESTWGSKKEDVLNDSKNFEKALKKRGYTLKLKKSETLEHSDFYKEPDHYTENQELTYIKRYTYDLLYKGKKIGECWKDITYNEARGWEVAYHFA